MVHADTTTPLTVACACFVPGRHFAAKLLSGRWEACLRSGVRKDEQLRTAWLRITAAERREVYGNECVIEGAHSLRLPSPGSSIDRREQLDKLRAL